MDLEKMIELSALAYGGEALECNDEHYGSIQNLLKPGRGKDMGDGWETRRRREPGYDWVIIKIGQAGLIEKVEIDTAHFKGNFPDRCSLQAANVQWGTDDSIITQSMFWPVLLGEQKLGPDAIHRFDGAQLADLGPVSHIRLNIVPDGGISRLRIWGRRT